MNKKVLIIFNIFLLLTCCQIYAMVEEEQTIDFIDLSGGKKFIASNVKKVSLKHIQEKINNDTGRELVISDHTDLTFIGIVKYDLPLGYALFAAKDIRKNKRLFSYGGRVLNTEHEKKYSNSKYIYDFLDAQDQGDLGSLCMHLFKKSELDKFNFMIDKDQYRSIRFENLFIRKNGNSINFHASCDIKKYSILGFSYGFQYWFGSESSPILVDMNNDIISELKITNPMICFRDILDKKNGTVFYFLDQIIAGIKNNNGRKNLCLIYDEEMNSVPRFCNLHYLNRVISSNLNCLFVFINTRNFNKELSEAIAEKKTKVSLPLSIYGEGDNPDVFWDGVTFEEHDL